MPVFRLKLHWLSGGRPQMDLLQIWCMEWSQWPDKQLRSQSAARVVRRSGGQFSALIAKSCKQVGGGWRAVVLVQQPVYEGWLVATASEVKVPIQPLCCCCDTISKHRSTAAAAKPRNVCQAAVTNSCQKLSLPAAAKLSKLSQAHPFAPPLSPISHQAASHKTLP